MLLERPFIEACIIHYMLLEDKLKEISVKVVFGVKFKQKEFNVYFCFKAKNLKFFKGNSHLRGFIKLFRKFCLELQWYVMVEMNIRFIK